MTPTPALSLSLSEANVDAANQISNSIIRNTNNSNNNTNNRHRSIMTLIRKPNLETLLRQSLHFMFDICGVFTDF